MDRNEVIALAREAGFEQLGPDIEDWVCFTEEIERFAALVAAAEREACAKVCDDLADASNLVYAGTAAMHCADAIRARGQA